jgi:hypothetical protein
MRSQGQEVGYRQEGDLGGLAPRPVLYPSLCGGLPLTGFLDLRDMWVTRLKVRFRRCHALGLFPGDSRKTRLVRGRNMQALKCFASLCIPLLWLLVAGAVSSGGSRPLFDLVFGSFAIP